MIFLAVSVILCLIFTAIAILSILRSEQKKLVPLLVPVDKDRRHSYRKADK